MCLIVFIVLNVKLTNLLIKKIYYSIVFFSHFALKYSIMHEQAYVCMYMYAYASTCVFEYTCECVHVYICMCGYVFMCVCLYA